jgi:hypothetical protein
MHDEIIKMIIRKIPNNIPPRQDSATDQIKDLVILAKRLRMHDAADVLKSYISKK